MDKYSLLDDQRKIIYDQLLSIIKQSPKITKYTDTDIHTIVRKIERSCYNRTVAECKRDGEDKFWENELFLNRYSVICNKIMSNMDPTNSVNSHTPDPYYLLNKILNKQINLVTISELTSYELNPQCNEHEINNINKRKQIKLDKKVSYLKVCSSCHEKKSTYQEFQARSSDEPSNFKYECTNCKHTWVE